MMRRETCAGDVVCEDIMHVKYQSPFLVEQLEPCERCGSRTAVPPLLDLSCLMSYLVSRYFEL